MTFHGRSCVASHGSSTPFVRSSDREDGTSDLPWKMESWIGSSEDRRRGVG
jgi:hypothetical protein